MLDEGKDQTPTTSRAEILAVEYQLGKELMLTSLRQSFTVLGLGTAGAVALLGVAFRVWPDSPTTELILLLLVPLVAYSVLLIWMGEIGRMVTAAEFMLSVEREWTRAFADTKPPVMWEKWMREDEDPRRTRHKLQNYLAVIGLLLGTAFGSILLGLFRLWHNEVGFALFGLSIDARSSWIAAAALSSLAFLAVMLRTYLTGRGFLARRRIGGQVES